MAAAWLTAEAAARAAPCPARFDIATNYYAVTGQTPPTLLASLHRSRPAGTNSTFDGSTTWTITWNYRYSTRSGGVRLDSVEITAKIAVTLPRWTQAAGAPTNLVQSWQRYQRALAAHEEGHVRLVREAVAEMQKGVSSLSDFDSKASLLEALDRACSQVVEKAKERERQYDAQTWHGRKQGAVWR